MLNALENSRIWYPQFCLLCTNDSGLVEAGVRWHLQLQLHGNKETAKVPIMLLFAYPVGPTDVSPGPSLCMMLEQHVHSHWQIVLVKTMSERMVFPNGWVNNEISNYDWFWRVMFHGSHPTQCFYTKARVPYPIHKRQTDLRKQWKWQVTIVWDCEFYLFNYFITTELNLI